MVLLFLLLSACGATREPDSTPPRETLVTDHPGNENEETVPADGCPATFNEAQELAACAPSACHYRDGDCACGDAERCSGMPPPVDERPARIWTCVPAVQPNGCPGLAPTSGDPCAHEGECVYPPPCCGWRHRATCVSERWVVTDENVNCPP